MMKFSKILLVLAYVCCCLMPVAAQENADSSAFEVQRKRVNDLLDARQQKFGAYDSSLTHKSGLFGLFKSKGDMQKSIDILKDIVITDNNIFLETQKLLKIKDFEKDKYQQLATDYDKQVSAYIGTINKLQRENDKLRQQADQTEGSPLGLIWGYVSLAAILILGFLLYRSNKRKLMSKDNGVSGVS